MQQFADLSHETLFQSDDNSMCVLCKGSRMLCGKTRCPILVKFYVSQDVRQRIDRLELDGTTPPGVFVGRFGYPHLYVGPLIPPVKGDTSLFDTPEQWIGKSIDDIVNFRFSLVRGKHRVHISDVENPGRIIDATRELALATLPTDIEAEFLKKPSGRIILDDEIQPFGPSAPLKKIDVGNIKIDKRIEKAYCDGDLKAKDAVLSLYGDGTFVSKIQRAFSVGAFGLRKNRKFVPTRWSITAVDSTISSELMKKVRDNPPMNEFRVYESWNLDNRFVILVMPYEWSYELVEAWYPNTVWNPTGKQIVIFSDAEGYDGRTTYAQIGGCYYAARLATSEFLVREKRQARVVILREAHSGYIMPVGVWNVRENVRNAFRGTPIKFETLNEVLSYVSTRLEIKTKRWIENSAMLRETLHQRRLSDFVKSVK